MARVGAAKAVSKEFAVGRLRKAIAFQAALETIAAFRDDVGDVDVMVSLAILAAIAFADAMTAAIDGKKNQQDHEAAPQLLRALMGNALPDTQYRRLAKLLGQKDQVQYGAGVGRGNPDEIVENLNQFAEFAIETLGRYGIRR
jgi:hypothetical protein